MRPLSPSTILLTLLLVIPLYAQDKGTKPKAADRAKPADEKAAQDAYVSVGRLGGVVREAADSGGSLVLRVTFRYLEPNVEAQRNYLRQHQQLLIRQQQILSNPNFVQAQQQMAQLLADAERLMQSQKDLFHIKSVDKDVEVGLAEDVKVRSTQPAQQFDDKGNIKRYTPKELRELKGKERLPGFPAELTDVQPGQTVLVQVARHRAAKVADAPPADKPAPAENKSQSTTAEPIRLGPRFAGTLILIVSDAMK